jgi:hypothetical protein
MPVELINLQGQRYFNCWYAGAQGQGCIPTMAANGGEMVAEKR